MEGRGGVLIFLHSFWCKWKKQYLKKNGFKHKMLSPLRWNAIIWKEQTLGSHERPWNYFNHWSTWSISNIIVSKSLTIFDMEEKYWCWSTYKIFWLKVERFYITVFTLKCRQNIIIFYVIGIVSKYHNHTQSLLKPMLLKVDHQIWVVLNQMNDILDIKNIYLLSIFLKLQKCLAYMGLYSEPISTN